MPDELPSGDKAVYVFLEMIALGFALAAVDSLVGGKPWYLWSICLVLALFFFLAGTKWPKIKLRIGTRFAAIVGAIAAYGDRHRFSVGLITGALLTTSICHYLERERGEVTLGKPSMSSSEKPPSSEQIVIGKHLVKVIDSNNFPVKGAEILFIRRNGVHSDSAVTDDDGIAEVTTLQETVSVFCGLDGFSAYYQNDYDLSMPLTIRLQKRRNGGSIIFADRVGYIPALSGRLNPILDTSGRMYLYADDISIDDGALQPATIVLNRPMVLEDKNRHRFEIEFVSIIASSSLIDYRKL